jgi:hypothetical protein
LQWTARQLTWESLGYGRAKLMAEYRAYAIGSDGHIVKAAALVCDDDDQAIARAKLEFGNYAIEVWSGVRFVVRLDALSGALLDGSAVRLQNFSSRREGEGDADGLAFEA